MSGGRVFKPYNFCNSDLSRINTYHDAVSCPVLLLCGYQTGIDVEADIYVLQVTDHPIPTPTLVFFLHSSPAACLACFSC